MTEQAELETPEVKEQAVKEDRQTLTAIHYMLGQVCFAVRDLMYAQTILLSGRVTADEAHQISQNLFARINSINAMFPEKNRA